MRSAQAAAGSPVLFFLFLTFLVLKLTGYIAWSWWWITAPFWVPSLIGGAALVVHLLATARPRKVRR
jgi:Flp pilus assembly protein TadB